MRLERIETLRRGQTSLPENLPRGEVATLNLEPSLLSRPKRRRLPEIKEESSSEGNSEQDDEEDLNWRAKAV